MSNVDPAWQEFTLPGFGLRLHYPTSASDGDPVRMDDARFHFRTMSSPEIYFEVSRHLGRGAREFYEREAAAIRRADPHVTISEPVDTSFAGSDALRFVVTFTDRERAFTLVERGGYLYRVIYDPRSAVNLDIMATIEFT